MEIEDPETVAKREFNKFDNEGKGHSHLPWPLTNPCVTPNHISGTGLMETNKLAELLNILELETEPD